MVVDAPPIEERPRRYSVQLAHEEWRDLLILLQCASMPGARYTRIIDSIQIQTSRIRE